MKKKVVPFDIMLNAARVDLDLVERICPPHEMEVLRSFFKNLTFILEDLVQKAEDGKPVVGVHFAFPQELFHCFDITPLCIELVPYMMSSMFQDGAEYFYDSMAALGHPYHTCTSQKGVMAMLQQGMVDLDVVVAPTGPCDNGVSSYQYFANYDKNKKVPLVVADLPVYQNKRTEEYYGEEFKRLLNEVGAILGQEPDFERMLQAIENNSKAHYYLHEINELRKRKPCPLESMSNALITASTVFFQGHPAKAQFHKEVYEIGKKRVSKNIPRPYEEKFRVVFPYMSMFFDLSFYEWMDRELGMVEVIDPFNLYFYDRIETKDIDEVIKQLAIQAINYPMIRQGATFVETFIDDSLWAAREFRADCAIFTAHFSCKQIVSAIQILKEAFRDELGIPMLTLELDCGDKRYTSVESLRNQVSEFAKTLL
ncbi:MAG: 2-hydroxyacyl-CoA dehydratase [Candidatus Helarchaeota archaeon]